jgi:dihydrofolate reductase
MRKIISMLHLSLDGLTAGPNDELDWITYDNELESYAHSMHDITDAVIWGRRTYEGMASYWLTIPGNPDSSKPEREHAAWLDSATKIVISRSLDQISWGKTTNTVLIKDNVVETLNRIKQQPGKDIWLLGSTALVQYLMPLDVIDEYRFNINPTILGKGKSLFAGIDQTIPLTLIESKTLKSGVIVTRYEPNRA